MKKERRMRTALGEVFPWPAAILSTGLIVMIAFIRLDFSRKIYVLSSWLDILGGIKDVVDPPAFDLLQWLMLVAPPMYFVGTYLEQETRKRLPFVLIRSRSYSNWWFRIMKSILLGCLAHTLICFSIPTFAVLVSGGGLYQSKGELLKAGMTPLVFFLYIVMASILQALCYLLWEDKRFSFIVVTAFPMLSHLLCYVSPQWAVWSPGSWGMAWRYLSLADLEESGLKGNQYYIILPLMLLVSVGMYIYGKWVISKKGITVTDE